MAFEDIIALTVLTEPQETYWQVAYFNLSTERPHLYHTKSSRGASYTSCIDQKIYQTSQQNASRHILALFLGNSRFCLYKHTISAWPTRRTSYVRYYLFESVFEIRMKQLKQYLDQCAGDFLTDTEVVFGTTADEGLLYLLTAITDTAQLDLWR